jgi:hypothetical protein
VANLDEANEEWLIALAKNGDASELALYLRSAEFEEKPVSKRIRNFLADVFGQKIKLKRQKKLTYAHMADRWLREKMVLTHVRMRMGKRRDRFERARLIDAFCKSYGTNPTRVEDFIKHAKRRRK